MANSPILPIDTVQAVVHSAYPWLLRRLRNDPDAEGEDDRMEESAHREAYRTLTDAAVKEWNDPERKTVILDDPARLTRWMGLRFAIDGVEPGSVLNPFYGDRPSYTISTSTDLHATYAVQANGIVLPRVVPPGGGSPATGDRSEAAAPGGWRLLGSQIDLLRTAASLATARLWQEPDFGVRGKDRFAARVRDAYKEITGSDLPAGLTLGQFRLNGTYTTTPGAYYNPEDGAGYFQGNRYVLFEPPPPPALTGWVSPDTDVWGQDAAFRPCAMYAVNRAYATDCTCVLLRQARFFRPDTLRGEAPPEARETS